MRIWSILLILSDLRWYKILVVVPFYIAILKQKGFFKAIKQYITEIRIFIAETNPLKLTQTNKILCG